MVNMSKDRVRQISVVLAVIATLAVNALANILPLNGQNTGEISNRFQVYFVPAGYVFSIWGLIYIGLIVYATYQALASQRENPRLRRVGYLFVLSCLANITWLFLLHYNQFPLSLVAMLALLVLLILIYLRLGIGRDIVSPAEKWLVNLLFSIYLGWVSVATIANVSDVLYYLHWNGWGIVPQMWAVIMLLIAAGLAVAMGLDRRDVGFMLVFVWAFIGIAVKQAGTTMVVATAWVLVGVILMVVIWLLYTNNRAHLESS
jgi:tryptophan-rich sensory protein